METNEFRDLLSRYRAGQTSFEENAKLETWYMNLNSFDQGAELSEEDLIAARASIMNKLEGEAALKKHRLWPVMTDSPALIWKIAAAVAAITLGVWLYYASSISDRHPEFISGSPLANDIAPGKNTATITFDNGEVVDLNEEELDISSESGPRRGGTKVSSETPQFLASRISRSKTIVLSTPRGGQYQVVLPDGTKVWLNADSKISFPSQFFGRQRKINLTGEAYFEVVHNKAKPFMVESTGQEVTVLGTHFNINSYTDEGSTKTTLLEGSINVNGKILIPNQQATLKGEALQVKTIEPELAIAWKNNKFIFENDQIHYIMRMLARWYNVDVRYEGEITKETFGGAMSRYENISEVLKPLEATGKVKFKIEGRTVIVSK